MQVLNWLREKTTFPRNVIIFLSTGFLGAFELGFLMWFLPVHIVNVKGVEATGIIFIVTAVVAFLGGLWLGPISDTIGRRKPFIVVENFLFTGGIILLAIDPTSVLFLLIAVIVVFAVLGAMGGITWALLTESIKQEAMGRIMSILGVVTLVGMASGSAILGFISEIDLSLALMIVAILSLIEAISRLFLVETRRDKTVTEARKPLSNLNPLPKLKLLFSTKQLHPLMPLMIIWGFNSSLATVFVPAYYSAFLGWDKGVIGSLFAAFAVGQAIGEPIAGWFTDKYGAKRAFLVHVTGNIFSMALFLSLSLLTDSILIAIPLILSSPLDAFGSTAHAVFLTQASSEDLRATAHAGLGSLSELSSIPAPALGAILWALAPPLILLVLVLFCVAEIPLVLRLKSKENAKEG